MIRFRVVFLPSYIGRNLCGILEIFSPILWSTLLRSWTFFHCFPRSIFNALHLFDSLKTVRGFCYKRLLTACRAWWVMRFRIGAWRSKLLFAVRTAGDKLKQQIWRWFKSKLFSNIFISFEKALTTKPNITTCSNTCSSIARWSCSQFNKLRTSLAFEVQLFEPHTLLGLFFYMPSLITIVGQIAVAVLWWTVFRKRVKLSIKADKSKTHRRSWQWYWCMN